MLTRHGMQVIPLNVLTGFLGSGKTTLLGRLLASPVFADCAVLINELGETGLDHQLLEHLDQETIVLQNGCVCCSIRSDLQQALNVLYDRRERNLIPAFSRVIIETTGLADPVPVLNTIVADPVLRHHFRLSNIVTTVDAVNGLAQLQHQAEARRQAAVADRLIITKADLVDKAQLKALQCELTQINASAMLLVSHNDIEAADLLLAEDMDDATRAKEVRRWFPAGPGPGASATQGLLRNRSSQAVGIAHRSDISTLSLFLEKPVNWIGFGVWLSMLLHSRSEQILRVKGVLNVQGSELPVVIHGVQHLIHPPTHLSAWPDEERRSRLVLIGKLPSAATIYASLEAFGC